VLLLGITLTLAACSAGDPIESYFTNAAEIAAAMRADSIDATPRGAIIIEDGVTGVNEARRTALIALGALDPPAEVAPEHTALTTALNDLVAATDTFLDVFSGANAADFEQSVRDASDLEALADRVALACDILGERATALGHEVDLRC